jgi:hypothetical protein
MDVLGPSCLVTESRSGVLRALNLVQIEAYVYCRRREVKLILMGLRATLVEACSAVLETKYSGEGILGYSRTRL